MAPASPRLAFSHSGQHFVVKSRPTPDGLEVRGFWYARSTARTRFVVVVPSETIEGSGSRTATNPTQRAMEAVKDEIIAAIDKGEPLGEGAAL